MVYKSKCLARLVKCPCEGVNHSEANLPVACSVHGNATHNLPPGGLQTSPTGASNPKVPTTALRQENPKTQLQGCGNDGEGDREEAGGETVNRGDGDRVGNGMKTCIWPFNVMTHFLQYTYLIYQI